MRYLTNLPYRNKPRIPGIKSDAENQKEPYLPPNQLANIKQR